MINWNEYKSFITLLIYILISIVLVSTLLNPYTLLEFVGTVTIFITIILINYKAHIYIKLWFSKKGISKEFNINEKYVTLILKDRMLWIDFSCLFVHIYKIDSSGFIKEDNNGSIITYKLFGDGKYYVSYNYVSSIKDI
jgi:hypothetical protein